MRGREEVEKYQGQHRWYFTQSVAWVGPLTGSHWFNPLWCMSDRLIQWQTTPLQFLGSSQKSASDWRSIHWVWDCASTTFSVMFLVIHVMRLHVVPVADLLFAGYVSHVPTWSEIYALYTSICTQRKGQWRCKCKYEHKRKWYPRIYWHSLL